MDQFTAQYHLPGLFEFYALYRLFLPLFFEHREYFYDWCGIGSIYGAPEGCLWGGGRVSCGDCDPRDALALLRDYGISARLTFSNSLLRPEHLSDPRCNALCRLFESSGENGIIVHSDLLVDHLRQHYPGLYLVSSTTKVLTDFSAFRQEHRVITGVTLRSSKQCYSFDSQTDVHFGPLSDEQIEYYIDTYKPFDKAGAYGIQEWIGYVAIQGIDGSFYNVMGLPIQKLYNELDRFIDQL